MSNPVRRLVRFSVERPWTVLLLVGILTALLAVQFPKIIIDTDPENMLREDEPIRVFHDRVKKDFGIDELIVLGIVHDDGIFNPGSLEKIRRITEQVLRLKGVIADDVMSLTVTNNVVTMGGALNVRPPMTEVPEDEAGIEALRNEVLDNPLFRDRLVSSDGRGAAIYIPIESKDIAHEVGQEVEAIYTELGGPEKYYMAGLPVAEDTFGGEMFVQMAVVAPLAGGLLMVILFIIFGRVSLVVPPMAVAMLSVIWTMGAMVGLGFKVHIMSSMIPVFLMPIAVCDSVHILSDFFEKLPRAGDRKQAIIDVFDELMKPMFFTSITTAVGFSMLASADIPPVKAFGLFVALGVLVAWFLTMTVIPALLMILRERKAIVAKTEGSPMLAALGRFSLGRSKLVVIAGAVLTVIAVFGVMTLVVNDNPVKWFKKSHPIRVADSVLNDLIGGTYISYLVLEGDAPEDMKRPEVMRYIEGLQEHLESLDLVGKTTSVADVVKRVNYVLHDEDRAYDVLPDTREAIGQYLFLFLMSSEPDELDNMVDYDFSKANVWVQLKSGDNKDMTAVVDDLERYMEANPAPDGVRVQWSGLPYLNITWQKLMVTGMLKATVGSWWVIFALLIVQFRSLWWAVAGMLPLGFSVLFTYGILGFGGKEYDMPIAVCSTLALGLGVDFAIHFVQRFRNKFEETGDLEATMQWAMGGEPALAIFRNAVTVGLGFLPLVLATLLPYVTVGLFFGSLAFFAGITTLIFLPALIGSFKGILLKI
jgi:hypothetical protein